MNRRFSATAAGLVLALVSASADLRGDVRQGYEPRVGDLIFQSLPHGPLTDAIEGATKSPFSHVGIVTRVDDRWMVLEAVGPVVRTGLDEYLRRGRGGGFAVYRFASRYDDKLDAVIAAGAKQLGKPYDFHYDFDDANLYCSELIYKAFQSVTGEELGTVRKLGDLDWRPYEQLIRTIELGGLPLERRMITPRDLSEAKQLKEVLRKGI